MKLTARQAEILALAKTGASYKEIAIKLGISPNTVKARLHLAFARLGVTGVTALLVAENAALKRRLARLGSMEGFTGTRAVDPEADAELLARIDYARETDDGQ